MPYHPRICVFDPASHEKDIVHVLLDMRGQTYPGAVGGETPQELIEWLTRFPMISRWVALNEGGQAIGHIALSHAGYNGTLAGAGREALEITRLFVHPKHMKTGTGFMLLDQATQEVRKLESEVVLLVSDYLAPAIALYESTGWILVGEKISDLSKDRLLIYRHQY